jgi:uncharacterized protein with ParB-like and HNH nuclease domain
MKANETRVDKFLSNSETTFAIPVYQRNYDWTKVQCQQLFDDIILVGNQSGQNAHFIGSIVYVHDDVYTASGLTELTIIDGQQRLTTLTLIYVAIFRFALRNGNGSLAQRINKMFLINEFSSEKEKLKLKPTDNNKAALAQVLDPTETNKVDGYSRLIENFRFFENKITTENIENIQRGLSKLIFVDIALDRQKDNPQRIFESLNSTGLELSQSDLIRNYILMGLSRTAQEDIYKKFWAPIEKNARNQNLNQSKVSDFIRDYLTLKEKEIPNKNAVYEKFKEKYPTPNSEELREALDEIKSLSEVYKKLLNPTLETDIEIQKEITYINNLEINVAFPFLMRVYQDFEEENISKEIFLNVLRLIQSFVWRRFIVSLPTNALNKIFMTLYDRVELTDYVGSVEKSLMQKTGSQRFPRDLEVVTLLKEKDMYNTKSRTRSYFFDRIENYKNNELVDVGVPAITVEHIFPQNPDSTWKMSLDAEEFEQMAEKYLNTVGNITLSGNNGNLGNRGFLAKKDMNVDGMEQGYKFSRLWLNRDLKEFERWGVSEISSRADRIASRFLEVWPQPQIEVVSDTAAQEINIFDADDPRHRKLDYAVFFGQQMNFPHVAKLYVEVLRQLLDLQPDAFHGTKLGERIQLTSDADSLRFASQISDNYFIEGNIDNAMKFDRMKFALTELDIEDELYIKYAQANEPS